MDENKIKLPIRSALIPNFYKSFHCLMGACQDNCCDDGWGIHFSKKDYLRIKRTTEKDPELHAQTLQGMRRLRRSTPDGAYAEFCITDQGRCAFHTEEGLCQLQLACGEATLPLVCRLYPRSIGYTPTAKEYVLSPSCEGVLQQLWDLPEGVEFVEEPLPRREQRGVAITQGGGLTRFFTPLRELFIDILQNRTLSLTERMLYLGITIQRLLKEDWEILGSDEWIKQTVSAGDAKTMREVVGKITGNRDMCLMQNLKVLNSIRATEKGWPAEIRSALGAKQKMTLISVENTHKAELSVHFSRPVYESALAHFQAAFADRAYFFENLMVAAALFLAFPHLSSKEELWKSYVSLCSLYSFYRFVSVLGCKEETTKERLFHMIVMASRSTLHNRDRLNGCFQEDLFQHDSSTLAHMAILLIG